MTVELLTREHAPVVDIYQATPLETPAVQEFDDDRIFEAAVTELERWLEFRVKNVLVLQLYKGASLEKGTLDLDAIANVVKQELVNERDRHFESMMHLELDTIPKAHMNKDKPKHADDFTVDDIAQLEANQEMHESMAEYIQSAYLETDNDTIGRATKACIEKTYRGACKELEQTVDIYT